MLPVQVTQPGHGEVMHYLSYQTTVRDLLKSVIGQVNAIFRQIPGGGNHRLSARKRQFT